MNLLVLLGIVGSMLTGQGLNASSGEFPGTPTVVGTQNLTVQVASEDGQVRVVLQPSESCSDTSRVPSIHLGNGHRDGVDRPS